jgi:glycosyltransferase involved in cell wall biosynthesis
MTSSPDKAALKILLVGNYFPDQQESMQRFAEVLRHELQERGHAVRLLRPTPRANRKQGGPSGMAKWLGYIDKFVLFPQILRRAARRADIVHICDHSNAPYIHSVRKRPHLITCNDVLAIRSALGQVPQNPTRWSGKILQRYIVSGLNEAGLVACISRKTREQLLSVTALPPEDVQVVYMGQNYPYSPMPTGEARRHVRALLEKRRAATQFQGSQGFILHVGGNHWYKNREGVLKIYAALCQQNDPSQLPLLFMAGQKFTDEMNELVRSANLHERVLNLDNVSNEDLRALYSCAELLLFPSLAEGFGWPIAEAQACGCRVVTTNDTPMTEVGGDAALYCDPKDIEASAQCVLQMLNESASARSARIEAGKANSERFSTRHMIESYLNLYQEIIAKHRPVPQDV